MNSNNKQVNVNNNNKQVNEKPRIVFVDDDNIEYSTDSDCYSETIEETLIHRGLIKK